VSPDPAAPPWPADAGRAEPTAWANHLDHLAGTHDGLLVVEAIRLLPAALVAPLTRSTWSAQAEQRNEARA
jgi:hypothetical protein